MTFSGKDLNLERLIETRMLVTANSGGGKSYFLRNVLENTHGKVQHIVLDMEGEFSTLREKYDYVLIGKGGDIDLDIRGAELLAKKLLELKASAIIDLYELPQHERIRFVKLFFDSMVNSPKELWNDCLVFLDEGHVFAAEKRECASLSAVSDMATRGRKRGFCLVIATQRLSSLNKDVAAQMTNIVVGRTTLDIDMKRSAESLGFVSREQTWSLKNLEQGEFFVYGPAISNEVKKIKVGPVHTTIPKRGENKSKYVSPPKGKVLAALDGLKDLPQKAEEELREISDYKIEISKLRRELSVQKRPGLTSEQTKTIQTQALNAGYNQRAAEERVKVIRWEKVSKELSEKLQKIHSLSHPNLIKVEELPGILPEIQVRREFNKIQLLEKSISQQIDGQKPLREGAMKMLSVAASYFPDSISIYQMGTLAGFTPSGGTFQTYLSELKRNEWLEVSGEQVTATEKGMENAGSFENLPTGEKLLELWCSKFRDGAARMLRRVVNNYPNFLTQDELGAETGFTSSGGTFQTYLSELRRNKLIEVTREGVIASKWLVEK